MDYFLEAMLILNEDVERGKLSIENAIKFIARIGRDSALKASLAACQSAEERLVVANADVNSPRLSST